MLRKTSLLLASLLLVACAGISRGDEPKITPDVIYGHKNGMALVMHVYQPAKPNGAAVVEIVSGGYFSNWTPANPNTHLVSRFLQSGYTVFSVFHGSNPKYTVPEIVDDMRLAVRFIRLHADDYGVDAKRIGAIGSSAGGHLALMLATTGDDGNPNEPDPIARTSSRVAAVIAIAAPSDMRNFDKFSQELLDKGVINKTFSDLLKPAFAFKAMLADSISPVLHVTPDDAATMLIHGDADKLVPIEFSHQILAPLKEKNVPAELVTLPGVGHAPTGEEMKKLVASVERGVEWFDKYLAAPEMPAKSAGAGDQYFDSAGAKIHYVVEGEGEPVILVHGFTSHIKDWQRSEILPKLSKRFQVIAFDHRGHGDSEKLVDPQQYGVEMAADVLRLMDHLKIEKAHIVGYSLGGVITEYLLVNHPDRFITGTIGGMGWIKPGDPRMALLNELAKSLETGEGLGALLVRTQPASDVKRTSEEINGEAQSMLAQDRKARAACLRGIPQLIISEEQLKRITLPAIAIVGSVDPWKVTVDEMAKVMPNLKVHVIEGTNHETCPGSPKFVEEIMTFVGAHAMKPVAGAK